MFRNLRDKSAGTPPAKATPLAAPPTAPVIPAPGIEPRQATIRYVDRPDCEETFADAVHNVVFDGQTLRIEFAVTRLDEIKADAPLTGHRYPACRLVLPPSAAVDLINRLQQIAAGMSQAGLVKQAPKPAGKDA